MPEDDFDIYGEDDGFSAVKPVEGLEEYNVPEDGNEHAAERASSPMVGEKRQREDDDAEQPDAQRHNNPSAQNGDANQHAIPVPGAQSPNGSANGSAMVGMANGGQAMNGGVTGQGTFDALYIGDLQWVCFSMSLSLLLSIFSETLCHVFVVFSPVDN